MKLPGILEKYRTEIEIEIRSLLDGRCLPLYDMMRYHLGWTDDKGKPVNNNAGKALRPALCLFSCEAVGGKFADALPAAGAIELVHNFSLIHDDIQDDDVERRHRPTVWAIWGKPQAINAGTAMRILADTALFRLHKNGLDVSRQMQVNRMMDEATLKLIEGQYLDISYENRLDIGTDDYLAMIEGKTAALISSSMEIGAFLGTDDEDYISRFGQVGKNLGMAFQIKDDILGIWGQTEQTGKSSGNDIRRKKKGFPLVYAMVKTNGTLKKQLAESYQGKVMDDSVVEKIMKMLEQAGAKEESQKMVAKYTDQGRVAFAGMELNSKAKKNMEEMFQFLEERTY